LDDAAKAAYTTFSDADSDFNDKKALFDTATSEAAEAADKAVKSELARENAKAASEAAADAALLELEKVRPQEEALAEARHICRANVYDIHVQVITERVAVKAAHAETVAGHDEGLAELQATLEGIEEQTKLDKVRV
jgi:hypothetical protein